MSAGEWVAVVTGGNRGIGREVARQLGQRGFSVILGSRDPVAGERAAADLAGDGLAANYVWTFTTGPALVQSQLNLGAVQAFGQIQASGDGSIRNDVVAGEPVAIQTAVDATGTIHVRHGFYLPPAR